MHLVSGRNLNIFLANFLTGWVTSYLGQVGLTRKKIGSGHRSICFCFGSKKSGSGQVFFWLGQKFLTHIVMSNYALHTFI